MHDVQTVELEIDSAARIEGVTWVALVRLISNPNDPARNHEQVDFRHPRASARRNTPRAASELP